VLAARGELETGETLARDAVGLAAATDWLEFHAHARSALAEVLAKAGRYDEAASELHEAIRLYEQKESVLAAERVRVRLRELTREPLAQRE
jgi:predicted Zn-dependent protease